MTCLLDFVFGDTLSRWNHWNLYMGNFQVMRHCSIVLLRPYSLRLTNFEDVHLLPLERIPPFVLKINTKKVL